jgi:lipoprotein-anchoring transpeptidase ErfK/SrfK
MGSSQIFKISAIIFSIILVIMVVFGSEKSPEKEIGRAREAISEARAVGAESYSGVILSEAVADYNSAMQLWKNENERFIVFRNYSRVRNFAKESLDRAIVARDRALINAADMSSSTKKQLLATKELIKRNQELFNKLPLSSSVREENSKGRLLFAEAERAYNNGHITLCDEKTRESIRYLTSSYTAAKEIVDEYLTHWPLWNETVNQAIASSRRGKTAVIIIDKFARRCYLYVNGAVVAEYEADLGRNWIGDKREKGDKATPEGVYKVTKMKSGSQTSYYKALLIDYPNADDKARFIRAKRDGLIQKEAEIGSLIEIHGKGGTGTDWTDGCIALENGDMDKLFTMSSVGMPVIIVGTIGELDIIMKSEL